MAEEHVKHKHNKNDIIIKDQDGTYKILRNGQFVPLDQVEAEEHLKEHQKETKKDEKEHGLNAEEMKKAAMQPPKSTHEIKGLADEELQKKAQSILRKSGVTFASGEAQRRAIKSLVAHLKGVRKPFETRDSLMKHPNEGGAGIDQEDANKILTAAGAKMDEEPKQEKKPAPKQVKKEQPKQPAAMPVGKDVSQPAAMPKMKSEPEKPKVAPPASVTTPKPQVVDVQQPKAPTVGLAGELSYSLADWRRVGVNPQDRIKKIENQLGVLEEDNYPKRLQGLTAWRNSEVMRLYLEAGKRSLEKGIPVQEVLGSGNSDQLTWEEWEAIAELNNLIRG